jgi:hypothetical protein
MSSDIARGIEDSTNQARCGLAPGASREYHARQFMVQDALRQKITNG